MGDASECPCSSWSADAAREFARWALKRGWDTSTPAAGGKDLRLARKVFSQRARRSLRDHKLGRDGEHRQVEKLPAGKQVFSFPGIGLKTPVADRFAAGAGRERIVYEHVDVLRDQLHRAVAEEMSHHPGMST